jgi:hypothetical protein
MKLELGEGDAASGTNPGGAMDSFARSSEEPRDPACASSARFTIAEPASGTGVVERTAAPVVIATGSTVLGAAVESAAMSAKTDAMERVASTNAASWGREGDRAFSG